MCISNDEISSNKPNRMALIILNIIFCIAFIGFAYVNLNDKDSWLWIPIYMLASICCGLAVFNFYYPFIYLGAIVFYLVYAVILFLQKMAFAIG
ncbi:hypothetical protein L950_0225820 [Sphingobacterium sp. IITKGP-BTPF85]|nr:hypothetical protein L950_0225820 [Sphingobacterium sp. IITKGP-BTPF85]